VIRDGQGDTIVVGVQSQGVQPTYQIETRRGRRIVANAEHRFLTWTGWRRVEELRPGERIAAPRRYDLLGGTVEPEAEVKLVAYLIGDGCLVGRKAAFTNTNERLLVEFETAAVEAGLGTCRYDSKNVGLRCGRTGWREAWGIRDKNSATKTVPDRIFRADQATQALFLNRLFACDGHATTAGNGIIGYASKSRDLIDGVAHLLLRLGIACSIQKNDTGRFGTQWRLAIGTRDDCERFASLVGIFGKEEALGRLLEHMAKRGPSNDRIDLIPAEWRKDVGHGEKWFKNRGLRMGGHSPTTPRKVLAAADLVGNVDLRRKVEGTTWLEITSIESAGEAEVWDIETESHTFIANDIVTHNSSTVWTYALRRLCEDHHLRIGIISGTDDLAIKFLNEIKFELEANEDLKRIYGGPFVGDIWTKHELVLRDAREGPDAISGKDVSVFAIGRGGQISSRHCDLLIADDVESADTVRTENVRQGTSQWWAREVQPVLSPGGKFIVVGCLDRETPVLMADGTWKRIDSVEAGEYVWSVDETGAAGPRRVEASLDQGEEEVLRIDTAHGSILATPWHPFLTARNDGLEWVRADELTTDDFIVESKETPGVSQFSWMDEDFCWLFGYLLGDGWLTSNGDFICCATGVNVEQNARVLALLKDWFPTVGFTQTPFGYIRGNSRPIAAAMAELGMNGNAKTKRIPEWVFRSTPEFRRAFLRGFAAADGHLCKPRQGVKFRRVAPEAYRVELANEELVGDLRRLALTCGVRTGKPIWRERTSQPPGSPEPITAQSWSVSLNFSTVGTKEFDPKGNVGRGTAGRYAARQAARILGEDSRVARVESVEPAGRRHVWDLTVEGTHAFIADGMAVHNTRKSHVDLYSRLISDPNWTTISDAASVWKEDGEPIWPEMWDKSALLVRKAILDKSDVLAWSQEYLNKPMPSDTQMFHPESWPIFLDDPHSLAMREDISVLQYWDLAISEKETADFTVGICAGVDNDNNLYLLEVRRGHWDFNRTLNEIGAMGASYPRVVGVGIEKVAYQAAAVQEATRRTMLPIIPIEVDRDKVTRARLTEARANANKVYRPKYRVEDAEGNVRYVDPEWWPDFATEVTFFPDSGTHDDQPDALSGVAKMAGWSAESIGYAYGVWTCISCGHMFVFEAGRACPKCGTKAPEKFDNPEIESMGGMLEDDHSATPIQVVAASRPEPKPVATLPPMPGFPAGANVYDVEVIPFGTDPVQLEALRQTVEQMGAYLIERDGRYFVSTTNAGFMRTALIQQGYVQSVI
jgi:predicted phage terminase large subunit-like protein